MSASPELTSDPGVLIEERRAGYVRYQHVDGRRWEVHGVCDRRGDCLIGAVIDGVQIRDHAHLAELCEQLGVERLGGDLDIPVAPGFSGCCPLRIVELER